MGKLILTIAGVISLLLFGTCAVCTMAAGVGAGALEETRKEREKKQAECAKTEAVEWATVQAGLKANEAKVVAAWKNSCAKITGTVDRIESGFDDKPFVVIGSGLRFRLHCQPRDEKKALELAKGQKITVWGIGGEEVIGSLTLEQCDW